jgi:hypothetical protein
MSSPAPGSKSKSVKPETFLLPSESKISYVRWEVTKIKNGFDS